MANKKRIVFEVFFIALMFFSTTSALIKIISPVDEAEIEVCIDYDELLNYCNETEMKEPNITPFWMNAMFVITGTILMAYWIPRAIKDIKELRLGYRSTWDDEFKSYKK